MRETYYVGAYWDHRTEPAAQCARRAETFVRLLAGCDPTYAQWYELQGQEGGMLDTFERFYGGGEAPLGGKGLGINTWTGQMEEGRGGMLVLRQGARAAAAPHSVLLQLPSGGAGRERLLTLPVLTGVVRAMALAWEPDWAVAVSDDFRDRLSSQGAAGTFLGWLTYLPGRRGVVPPLPEPVRVEPVEDKGTLVVLGSECLSAANPEHLTLAGRIQDALKQRGLLKRVRPRRR